MLFLQSITLLQFKNYSNRCFNMQGRITGICGNNGVGKTNLLDAIHYLCFTRSYFGRLDAANVQQGSSGFRLEGQFILNDKNEKTVCILRENGKKEFSVNDDPYDRFSQHIGRYPCVVIAPDDAVLITGASEERRKFLDALLSQLDSEYLQNLIVYVKVLQQRNSLLKSIADKQPDPALLEVLDEQLMLPAQYIFNKRKEFLITFLPKVKHIYEDIARQTEDIALIYESKLLEYSFADLLKSSRQKDFITQRTTTGIHRDDIELTMSRQPFKNMASQGQRKSLLFALKLAEMEVLNEEKGFAPLLLLDDIFEKLDEERIGNLLQKVCVMNDGQVFITDTNEDRLKEHLEKINIPHQIIKL